MDKNQNPEQIARDKIDKQLVDCGWVIQDKKTINLHSSIGVAVRHLQTSDGKEADYVLFVNAKPVGIIEAKKTDNGYHLYEVHEQSLHYATTKLKHLDNEPLPFVYESTGEKTLFTDLRDPKPRQREIFRFHRPQTFAEWLKFDKSLRARFLDFPILNTTGLRECQINAITNLEDSFTKFRQRALIQMATGSGKTFTAITAVYRLLKFAKAKRILFLVDTRNLGEQAEQEFNLYISPDNRKLKDDYVVQRLGNNFIPTNVHVCISTIQRMYSILKGEPIDDSAEDLNPNEYNLNKEPQPVDYNPDVPMEFFDFVIIDECHRSIYNLWRQVLDYFDAFLIGLTATPDSRTYAFFNENVVSEYTHEQAVIDGVNVGHEVYMIETEISEKGAKLPMNIYVETREKLSHKKCWQQLDEDIKYTKKELDKKVINPNQIRKIISTFYENLPIIFPNRKEVPKTLIFAKTDSHADDIIKIVREIFGEGNDFCKKLTYKSEEDPKSVLNQFRNNFMPRICVTVDMVATRTDVKPIECLIFMRDVKSKNYFEQMKGRGTRTFNHENLKLVSPSAITAKTHFVIVDAIGVTKTLKTDSRPLDKKTSESLKNLLAAVALGAKDEDLFTTLAVRLSRLANIMTDNEKERFKEKAGGKSINQVAANLLNAYDTDVIEKEVIKKYNIPENSTPSAEQIETVKNELVRNAAMSFNGELNQYIEKVRQDHYQIIDNINIDTLNFAGWSEEQKIKSEQIINDFREYLNKNKDTITALKILFNEPHRRREITYKMIKELLEKIKEEKPLFAPTYIWRAYENLKNLKSQKPENELIALVSLVRNICDIDKELTAFDALVDRNFQRWIFKKQEGTLKFTEEQMYFLRKIKENIATSFYTVADDLEEMEQGGHARAYNIFGDKLYEIIDEMNDKLTA